MVHIIDVNFLGLSETIAAFLIETQKGPVLVETGPHSTFSNLTEGIRRVGYSLEQIKHVFITHIHLDHAGAAWEFADRGATIYLHPVGKPHLQDPSKLLESAKRIYQDDMDRLWGELRPIPAKQLKACRHLEQIRLGSAILRAWHTPGHASHHIAWQYGQCIFTGDVAGVRVAEEGPVMPPCPPPDIDVEQWKSSIKMLMNKRFATLYLTHFGQVAEQRRHFVELLGRLSNWANWILAQKEAGKDLKEMTGNFEDYVREQLELAGVGEAEAKKYAAANPSEMSVTGLLRYWNKKIKS